MDERFAAVVIEALKWLIEARLREMRRNAHLVSRNEASAEAAEYRFGTAIINDLETL
jgi:hypothetical protein